MQSITKKLKKRIGINFKKATSDHEEQLQHNTYYHFVDCDKMKLEQHQATCKVIEKMLNSDSFSHQEVINWLEGEIKDDKD